MSTTSTRPTTATSTWSTTNRVGLGLTLLLGLVNAASAFAPTPAGEVGPPFEVLLADSALAVAVIIATLVAWTKGSRLAARIAAGGLLLIAVSAVPAFFVDVPPAIKVVAGAMFLLTVLAGGLMLAPAKKTAQ